MADLTVSSMFRNFTYRKRMPQVCEALGRKIVQVQGKIAERRERVVRIRDEYNITDGDMIELLQQQATQAGRGFSNAQLSLSYSLRDSEGAAKTVGAGVVQNLLTEKALIKEETAGLASMEQIVRNLAPYTEHGDNGQAYTVDTVVLSTTELTYLGF